jgi:2-amino-1-hydroxyethylphosphonate dioxygenase (glycine-forming)
MNVINKAVFDKNKPKVQKILSEINKLFLEHGSSNYFGENVSQFEHSAQTLMLAIKSQASLEIQVAAFLHDIGHLLDLKNEKKKMKNLGRLDHELAAALWLTERGFSEKIQIVIKNHVAAKRYLCFRSDTYFNSLSDASKETMKFQGGLMNNEEADVFEKSIYFEESIKLRIWDDLAKTPRAPTFSLYACVQKVERYLYFQNY